MKQRLKQVLLDYGGQVEPLRVGGHGREKNADPNHKIDYYVICETDVKEMEHSNVDFNQFTVITSQWVFRSATFNKALSNRRTGIHSEYIIRPGQAISSQY